MSTPLERVKRALEASSTMINPQGITVSMDDIRAVVAMAECNRAKPDLQQCYDAADALYLSGWDDARFERDYDPRGCDQWQAVVDLMRG